MRELWPGPLVVKGIQNVDDARKVVDLGVDGVVVSNHGGRQMDPAPASLDALPEVAAAVAGRVPIVLDSGVRTGADVFIALALAGCVLLATTLGTLTWLRFVVWLAAGVLVYGFYGRRRSVVAQSLPVRQESVPQETR